MWESASATLGERLTQRFEAAATSEQLTKALAAAKAAYANEAMAAQRAAVDEAVAGSLRAPGTSGRCTHKGGGGRVSEL